VRQGGLQSRPRYKSHRVVDDAHEIITAVETTTGAVDEGARLLALIEAHEDITDQAVRTALADSRYGSVANLVECQKSGIRPHLKLLGDSHRGKKSNRIGSRLRFEGRTELVIKFTVRERVGAAVLAFGDDLSDGGVRDRD
jgi:Transposase DDE domain